MRIHLIYQGSLEFYKNSIIDNQSINISRKKLRNLWNTGGRIIRIIYSKMLNINSYITSSQKKHNMIYYLNLYMFPFYTNMQNVSNLQFKNTRLITAESTTVQSQ